MLTIDTIHTVLRDLDADPANIALECTHHSAVASSANPGTEGPPTTTRYAVAGSKRVPIDAVQWVTLEEHGAQV